ncbi:MAG: hypothetical protein M3281_02000 [Chloroflexota bacterium]|nr:hypothetical protein [Chloroflexota bacterium]
MTQTIETEYTAPDAVHRFQRLALIVGIVGAIVLVLALIIDPAQLRRSFMFAYLFWTSLAVGSLAITLLQHLSGGVWGRTLRRFTEAGAFTIPLMGALFFLVVGWGLGDVYPWARPGVMQNSEALRTKEAYLNVPFFLLRIAIYFILWSLFALILNSWSTRLDSTGDLRYQARLTRVSAPGMVLFGVTITLGAVDLIMSLEPEWFSTIFGAIIGMTMVLNAFAFMIMMLALFTLRGPLRDIMSAEHFHDVGKLLHAFIILWTYFNFSQFLIIWVGNLPFEAVYYADRLLGGWEWVGLLVLVLQFIAPFLLLLSASIKRNPRALAAVALLVVVAGVVVSYWYVAPAFSPTKFSLHWMDFVAFVALGGIWLAAFLWRLAARPLLPLYVLPLVHPRTRRRLENVGH